MNIPFVKMHAQGNDFVILESNNLIKVSIDFAKLAVDVCDRHFGIGADGLVVLNTHEPQMTIYNADGSRAEMCGSALRCCCYLMHKYTGSYEVSIQTDNGMSKGWIDQTEQKIVTVQIGAPQMITTNLEVGGFVGDYIKVGNPHFVILNSDFDNNPHLSFSKVLSEDNAFTEGANIEFVRINSRDEIDALVWERGVGATLACGTGSTASVFCGQSRGLLNDSVCVNLPGGSIQVFKMDGIFYLMGSVELVANGEYLWKV